MSCFGPGPNKRIGDAIQRTYEQYGGYSCLLSFNNGPTRAFIDALVESAGDDVMEAALLYGSGESVSGLANFHLLTVFLGSDSSEAGIKLLLQCHVEKGEPERRTFIAREQSYHGTTAYALALGSYWARREPFEDVLTDVRRVSAYNPYRGQKDGETVQEYTVRLLAELEHEFITVDPKRVAGFVCEPVVGAVSFIPAPWTTPSVHKASHTGVVRKYGCTSMLPRLILVGQFFRFRNMQDMYPITDRDYRPWAASRLIGNISRVFGSFATDTAFHLSLTRLCAAGDEPALFTHGRIMGLSQTSSFWERGWRVAMSSCLRCSLANSWELGK